MPVLVAGSKGDLRLERRDCNAQDQNTAWSGKALQVDRNRKNTPPQKSQKPYPDQKEHEAKKRFAKSDRRRFQGHKKSQENAGGLMPAQVKNFKGYKEEKEKIKCHE